MTNLLACALAGTGIAAVRTGEQYRATAEGDGGGAGGGVGGDGGGCGGAGGEGGGDLRYHLEVTTAAGTVTAAWQTKDGD